MQRFGSLLIVLSALFVVHGAAFGVRAQESGSGIVSAMSFYPIPPGMPVLVRPLDDSPENLAIQQDIEQALANAGFAAAKDGSSLVLSFETRRELGGSPKPTRQVTNRFVERHEESDIGDRRYKPQIGKPSPKGPASIGASRFRLDATLDDKRSGKRLWRGWSIARMQGDETRSLARAMATVLVQSLGETIRQQSFDIPLGKASQTTAP